MDNLTHTLTGLMLARAGLRKNCSYGTAILMLASNAPDIDIVVRLFGTSLDYLDHHRGITHALIMSPVIGSLAVFGVALVMRKSLPWLRAILIATVAVICHLLMDWTNSYGIRMLLPFSSEWLRLDITNVIDLWIWVVLVLCVAGPLLSKLVSGEIGAKPGTGRGGAIFALLFLLLYNVGHFVIHARAINTLNSHSYAGQTPKRLAAFPNFANPFQWVSLVELDSQVIIQNMNLLTQYDPMGGSTFYRPQPSAALSAAQGTDTVRRFLNFAQFPFWRVSPLAKPEGAQKAEMMDLRFGDPGNPRFVATVIVDAAARVLEEGFAFGPLKPR